MATKKLIPISHINGSELIFFLGERYIMLYQIFWAYAGFTIWMATIAIIRHLFPWLEKVFLKEEVGIVAFTCFVTIQILFDIEKRDVAETFPVQYYFKVILYIADITLLVQSRVKVSITLGVSLVSLLIILHMQAGLFSKYLQIFSLGKLPKKSYHFHGTLLALANIVSLILMLAKKYYKFINAAFLKSFISCSFILYFFHTAIDSKVNSFLNDHTPIKFNNLPYQAMTLIKPVGHSIFMKTKKLKRLKFK